MQLSTIPQPQVEIYETHYLNMRRLIIIQHIEREGPGYFEVMAREYGFQIHFTKIYLGDQFIQPNQGDIILVLGGPMGIDDRNDPAYFWINNEIDYLQIQKFLKTLMKYLIFQILFKKDVGI